MRAYSPEITTPFNIQLTDKVLERFTCSALSESTSEILITPLQEWHCTIEPERIIQRLLFLLTFTPFPSTYLGTNTARKMSSKNLPILRAVATSTRPLYQLLRCINFAPRVHVQITEQGIRFAADHSRVMQGMNPTSPISHTQTNLPRLLFPILRPLLLLHRQPPSLLRHRDPRSSKFSNSPRLLPRSPPDLRSS